MNVTCNDRDRIFEDGTSAEWAALEAHAASCPVCKEEVRAWKSLSVAAEELRDSSDSPSFWPRIERGWRKKRRKKRNVPGCAVGSRSYLRSRWDGKRLWRARSF